MCSAYNVSSKDFFFVFFVVVVVVNQVLFELQRTACCSHTKVPFNTPAAASVRIDTII